MLVALVLKSPFKILIPIMGITDYYILINERLKAETLNDEDHY